MRQRAFAVFFCAAPLAVAAPDRSASYAPHGIIVPDPPPAAAEAPRMYGRTTGEKSGLPPLPARNDGGEDEALDPHDAPADAIAVPPPSRAGIEDIRHDADALPPAVAAVRARLIAAARTGDPEALREVFAAQRTPPLVAGFSQVNDPIAHLKNQSGDAEGREILAILIELLETGFVHVGPDDAGTYVWPYFAEVPLTELEPHHYVDVYQILTSIDVEELLRIGSYTFFRVGIAHDGRIRYFSAGLME